MALTSKPRADVTVNLTSRNTAAGSVLPTGLTFSALNWNIAQTVTITGVNDQAVDGDVAYTIVTKPAVSTDPKYNQLDPIDVSVTNRGTNLLDLQVANVAAAPTSPQSGSNVTVSWDDTLTGNVATPAAFYDSVTVTNLTTARTLASTQLYYDPSVADNGAIQPGQKRTRQYTFALPNGAAGVGQLQFTVTTDSTNAIREANAGGTAETNNSTSLTVTSTLALSPDLQVTNQSGQSFSVQWNDSNTGNGPTAGSWIDTLVVTNTTTGTTLAAVNVPYNGAPSANGPLAAGQSFPQTTAINLPDGTAGVGNIQFSVTVDAANNIFEYNSGGTGETNNTASIIRTATLASAPDWQVVGLQLSPATGLVSGQGVTVAWHDANTGNLQFTVTVNSSNTVFEDNPAHNAQANNTASISAASTAASYPDLQVTGVSATSPSAIQSGKTIMLAWNDANTGNAGTGSAASSDRWP